MEYKSFRSESNIAADCKSARLLYHQLVHIIFYKKLLKPLVRSARLLAGAFLLSFLKEIESGSIPETIRSKGRRKLEGERGGCLCKH
jgi:hypothetical protein